MISPALTRDELKPVLLAFITAIATTIATQAVTLVVDEWKARRAARHTKPEGTTDG